MNVAITIGVRAREPEGAGMSERAEPFVTAGSQVGHSVTAGHGVTG